MKKERSILGLDIGANSLGWALISERGNWDTEVIAMGSRIFDAGILDLSKVKGGTKCEERRGYRMARRMLMRRARRMQKIFNLLQHAGLLPPGNRAEIFNALDAEIFKKYTGSLLDKSPEKRKMAHVLPYYLRKCAVEDALPPFELGRALYHLAHRRGFKSSRKEQLDDKETGAVKEGIKGLRETMESLDIETLGAYFSTLDPEVDRIRKRWTARDMFEKEFQAIIEKQKPFHPNILTDDIDGKKGFITRLYRAFFYQRPLKSQRHLIGKCSLEPDQPRCRMYREEFQKFRIYQTLSNMRLRFPGNDDLLTLSESEREKLFIVLNNVEKLPLKEVKKLLGLKNNVKILLGEDEDKIKGNMTRARMRQVFANWDKMSSADQQSAITDVVSIQKEETLLRRALNHWKLPQAQAEIMSKLWFEDDFAGYSLRAIQKLLPHMEAGASLTEALAAIPEYASRQNTMVYKELPPAEDFVAMRNPIVMRSLTQVRVIVNAVIKQYGLPDEIHVELSRDLRNSAKQREKIYKNNKAREKERQKIVERLLKEVGLSRPSKTDILKLELYEECGMRCPYTGRPISLNQLFDGTIDIEHILPLSRSCDDSFANKTLCYHDYNRNVKKNRTPWECEHANGTNFEEIIERVKRFNNPEKLRRFEMDDEDFEAFCEQFSSRQLNDTRYASRTAMAYLKLLYDDSDKMHIYACAGGVTALMRHALNVNKLLNVTDADQKSRDDHRHHAVDAVVIAMISPGHVKQVADALEKYAQGHGDARKSFKEAIDVGPRFRSSLEAKLNNVTTSFAIMQRIRGGFHGANAIRKVGEMAHTVINLDDKNLTVKHIEKAIDPRVRDSVLAKMKALNTNDPKKAFSNPANYPLLSRGDGDVPTIIKKFRIRETANTTTIGSGASKREMMLNNNHHIIVYETKSKSDKVVWKSEVISFFEVARRKNAKEPIIQRKLAEGEKFLFSLQKGDCIQMNDENGDSKVYRIRGFESAGVINYTAINVAKKVDKQDKISFGRRKVSYLQSCNCRKVVIHPLGDIRWSND